MIIQRNTLWTHPSSYFHIDAIPLYVARKKKGALRPWKCGKLGAVSSSYVPEPVRGTQYARCGVPTSLARNIERLALVMGLTGMPAAFIT